MNHLSKHQIFKLFLIFPIIITLCSSLLSPHLYDNFSLLGTPLLTPGPSLFSFLMLLFSLPNGLASYYTYFSMDYHRIPVLKMFLAFDCFLFFWPIILFEYQLYFFALVWCFALFFISICIFLQLICFYRRCACLFFLCMIWCLFLCYLNLGIFLLN